jgi:hypothetical protein
MISALFQKQVSRRDLLRWSSSFTGGALLTHFFSGGLLGASTAAEQGLRQNLFGCTEKAVMAVRTAMAGNRHLFMFNGR